jgi:hypothetical protein
MKDCIKVVFKKQSGKLCIGFIWFRKGKNDCLVWIYFQPHKRRGICNKQATAMSSRRTLLRVGYYFHRIWNRLWVQSGRPGLVVKVKLNSTASSSGSASFRMEATLALCLSALDSHSAVGRPAWVEENVLFCLPVIFPSLCMCFIRASWSSFVEFASWFRHNWNSGILL